jgi:hypothetical protein
MGVKASFKISDVDAYIQSRMDKIDLVIIRRLQFLGEKLVNYARENGSYTDQTGNLRNSVGYVIVKNGKIINSNFQKSSSLPGADGTAKAQALANSLAANFKRGYAVIVVAGMNYAAAVESKGKDVLSSAEMLAKSEMPRMISELKLNIKNMK